MPGKNDDQQRNGNPGKSRNQGGKAVDTTKRWCSLHKKITSHNDADCFKKAKSPPKEGGEFYYVVIVVHAPSF